MANDAVDVVAAAATTAGLDCAVPCWWTASDGDVADDDVDGGEFV